MDPIAYEELRVKALTDRNLRNLRGKLFIKKNNQWKKVIQSPDHKEIIRSIHQGVAAGHLGNKITSKKIKERFARVRTIPVFLNFPPAMVYFAQK